MKGNSDTTARIRALNDQLRRFGRGGRVMMTSGIEGLDVVRVARIMAAVAAFDAFTSDNDPYAEHDCAILTVDGVRVLFKTDLYEDPEVKGADGQPATTRILTIMLAEEW
jgi:Protein of unknown function (DUF3768)